MADTQKQQEQNQTREFELNVAGMSCRGCEQALSMALKQHEAVESAHADARSGKVRVTVKGDVDLSELKQRIHAAGYNLG